jgi:hypothetical protein
MAGRYKKSLWAGLALSALALVAAPRAAFADPAPAAATEPTSDLARLIAREAEDAKQIDAQSALIAKQAKELDETKALIEQQQRQLDAMKLATSDLQAIRAGGDAGATASGRDLTAIEEVQGGGGSDPNAPSGGPVGEAPPPVPQATLALPEGVDVLTPKGKLVLDNAVEYIDSASDRIVFSGVSIAGAVLLGTLQANQTRDETGVVLNTLRYGLGDRWEIEGTVPWLVRTDNVTLVQSLTTNVSRTETVNGGGLGDIEGTLRYQVTSGKNGWPVILAALRVVSDSGTGPFSVKYDAAGIAQRLPTGSGFWELQPTVTFIYPVDPIVLYGSLGYQHGFGRNVDSTFGSGSTFVAVGNVQPGDSISTAIGFAFSLNPHFSFSLGYKDIYFFPTSTEFLKTVNQPVDIKQQSTDLQAGSFLLGGSYQLTRHVSLNLNFEFGVTPDAPNDTVIFRVPYTF